jgi:WD40 repeat protein
LTEGAHPELIAHLDVPNIPQGMAFSPTGDRLAVATYSGDLVVFDLANLHHPAFIERVDVFGGDTVGWTSDGSRILYAGQSKFATIDVRTHKISAQGESPVIYVGILRPSSTDGTIATAAYSGYVVLLRPDGTPSGRPELLADSPITDSIISPAGGLIAASGEDGTLTLWSLPDGSRLASDLPLTEGATSVAFLDNARLVLAGKNDYLDVVDLDPSVMISQACSLVGRNLTRQEFAEYLGSARYHKTCPQWPAGA